VDDLEQLRRQIDALDEQLVVLLNQRATCALSIGRLKEAAGLPVYQPTREADVLANVRGHNTGPLDAAAVTRLFERIIDEARRLERQAAGHGTD
jgi:chorismate mutase-like protein